MKIALVHDYIKEFGGAERVLKVLADMYPDSPIYTAFVVRGSSAALTFGNRKIVESKWGWLIRYANLYSPLRFLAPWIWGSIDLTEYDLVITSCSSYFARGFKVSPKTKVLAYCHTPPRFLYGYETSINLQRYWPVKIYSVIVNHYLRVFDALSAQRVDKWIVNSENVKKRVQKFYRKDSVVVYPPVNVDFFVKQSEGVKKEGYFLIVSRLVGAKGLVEAARAMNKCGVKLKVVGEAVGFSQVEKELREIEGVELLGRVDDKVLAGLYAKATGFLALARDEDFGITPVEAMASGTPVIAFNGGGFRETVIDGKTGILINGTTEEVLSEALVRFGKVNWERRTLIERAREFNEKKFETGVRREVASIMNKNEK